MRVSVFVKTSRLPPTRFTFDHGTFYSDVISSIWRYFRLGNHLTVYLCDFHWKFISFIDPTESLQTLQYIFVSDNIYKITHPLPIGPPYMDSSQLASLLTSEFFLPHLINTTTNLESEHKASRSFILTFRLVCKHINVAILSKERLWRFLWPEYESVKCIGPLSRLIIHREEQAYLDFNIHKAQLKKSSSSNSILHHQSIIVRYQASIDCEMELIAKAKRERDEAEKMLVKLQEEKNKRQRRQNLF